VNEEETKGCNEVTGCRLDHESIKPHTCPFKTEVNDDWETLCQCCEKGVNFCCYEV